MKKKEKTGIASMSEKELTSALKEVNDKLIKIHLDRATKPGRNTREARDLRKRKAVILTVLNEKETHEQK